MGTRNTLSSLSSLAALLASATASAQAGTVVSEAKISAATPGFTSVLSGQDFFGSSVTSLGDLDGDGVADLAIGARGDDGVGGSLTGAIHILFLAEGMAVVDHVRIRQGASGFAGPLAASDQFGSSSSSLGDLDGDGVADLAVGAPGDDEGGAEQGAVWILFLHADGTVKSERKISATSSFGGLAPGDRFGMALASVGDLNADGMADLAVGAPGDGEEGAIWLLFLAQDGSVISEQKIGESVGGFGGSLSIGVEFGSSLAPLGDIDANGVIDLAVGAPLTSGLVMRGAVWILRLGADGFVTGWHRIGAATGGELEGQLDEQDRFGSSLAPLGDLDGDGTPDLAAGAPGDDSAFDGEGAIWVLFLGPDGSLESTHKIGDGLGGFGGSLQSLDALGSSLAFLQDLDGDGFAELASGATGDDDGSGSNAGAAWVLSLDRDRTAPALDCPASIRVIDQKGSAPGEIVTFTVTATDDSDPAPEVVCVPPSGSFFPRGTTMVTCTATDSAGNESVCSFPVTRQPTTRPR